MNTLEKEFVPYQESLELKELGFDEPCFGEYRQWDGNEPWLQLYQHLDGCSTDPADYEYTQEALAPTFSQAFMFFRKKYGLHHIIHCPAKNVANFTITGFNIPSVYSNVELKSYEEAELACLIKLIQIVKDGNK